MSESICKFMPVKEETGSIRAVHFVYETELNTLSQPFFKPIYRMHLVTNGSGTLRIYNRTYVLEPGCVFFAFPGCPFFIEAPASFRFLYIGFMGSGVSQLLEELDVRIDAPVYPGFDHVTEFWFSAISRIHLGNANILAESVLLYTLSFLRQQSGPEPSAVGGKQTFRLLTDYVDSHYADPDISLKKLASLFSYTEKYLSALFVRKTHTGFRDYVNSLRIQKAQQLLIQGGLTVTQIAAQCGFRDGLYFSKVFKKRTELSPVEFQLQRAADHKGART